MPTFFVDLVNNGSRDLKQASAVVSSSGVPISEVATVKNLLAGAQQTLSLTPKSPLLTGYHELRFELGTNDQATSNTDVKMLCTFEDTVHVLAGADLEFVPGSAKIENSADTLRAHSTVFVSAQLRNNGDVDVADAQLQLLVGGTNGYEAETLNDAKMVVIPLVAAHSMQKVLFRWEDDRIAGEQHVSLVVNRNHSIKETSYDNNTIDLKPFDLPILGNFGISRFAVSPHTIKPGTPVNFEIVSSNSQNTARGPVTIEFGFKNKVTGNSTTRRIAVRIPAEGETTSSGKLLAVAGQDVAFAEIDPSLDLEESMPSDNSTETQLLQVLPIAPGSSAIQISKDFQIFGLHNIEWLPGGTLRLQNRFTTKHDVIPLDMEQVVTGTVTAKLDNGPTQRDNKWSVAPWRLQAGSEENPGPITLRIPGGENSPGLMHDIFVTARAPEDRASAVQFRARFEQEQQWRSFEVPSSIPAAEKRVYLGRYDLGDGVLDLEIDNVTSKPVTLAMFEIVPVEGTAVSPAYELPPVQNADGSAGAQFPGSGMLKIADTAKSAGEHLYQIRIGSAAHDAIQWHQWKTVEAGQNRIALGQYIQVRALLRPGENRQPLIRTMELAW
jgi:hypothetical protein